MTNIIINSKNRTLEVTKKFASSAARFGSDEYKELKEAHSEFPTYKVVIKTSNRKAKSSYKGLTYDFMEKYIKSHDNEQNEILAEFETLRGKSESAIALNAQSLSYVEIKVWFLDKFPTFTEFTQKREALLNKSEDKKSA